MSTCGDADREKDLTVKSVASEMHDEDARIPACVFERWLQDLIAGLHPVPKDWLCASLIRALVAQEQAKGVKR